jgi:2-polyprenyl-3-methyl-5-hydroxy-6-metoxy-1,4-benzoquinol methylase
MSIRLLWSSVRWAKRVLPLRTFDASTYWEKRHQSTEMSLRGVGHVGLSEADNAADYAVKLSRMLSAISRTGALTGKTILDAGCGIGLLTEAIINAGADVCAVDISPTAIANAKQRVPTARFECRSLETLPYKEIFDVIVSMDVLFHIVDDAGWKRALFCLGAAVKPDGLIIIQEFFQEQQPKELGDAPHVCWRTQRDYRKALAERGLRISDLETYNLSCEGAQATILTVRAAQ